MTDRSNIDLLANATSGVNLGTGSCIFKCKNITGNTLQFKTISVAGGLSIITGDTTLTISGSTGGSFVIPSGLTNYLLKATTTGVTKSSIYDSGNTNIFIRKNNVYIGNNSGITLSTIRPTYNGIIQLVASSGVNIGSLNDCLCIGHTVDGLTLCSAAYCDLLVHAGSYVTTCQAGKHLLLSGGDGQGNVGGDVIITGSTGTVSGNIILSTPTGRIKMCNLPPKTTETCGIFINTNGCLSTGIVGTGSTTIIGGTANRIPVFNSTGNNIQNSNVSFTGNTLYSPVNSMVIAVPNGKSLFLNGSDSGTGVNNIILGASGMSASVTDTRIITCGLSNNINISLFARGSGYAFLYAPTVWLGNNGSGGLKYTIPDSTLTFPYLGRICSCNADQFTNDAKSMNIYGGCGYGAVGFAGSGATVNICAGNAASGIIATPKIGGSVVLKAGLGICGGANGRIILSGLPAKTTESCVIYVDSTGKLSTGVSSGGTGGLSVAVTGATNGVCLYNSKNVCLGGLLSAPVLICNNNNTNGLTLCTISTSTDSVNNTYIGSGNFVSTSTRISTSWCTYIENGGIQINLLASNIGATCSNQLVIRPDMVQLTSNGGGSNSGWQYAADYCVKMNSNERAIVDSGWVKRYALGGWSNFTNGSTVAGCNSLISGNTKCNTLFGVNAGRLITNGCANTGVGTFALSNNTSGCFNTANGVFALNSNTTGCYNTANGVGALNGNTIGHCNVGVGMNALQSNINGSNNVAVGINALYANSSTGDNVAIGACALAANIQTRNVAVGSCALMLNVLGSNNIGIGACALRSSTNASYNIAIGNEALYSNTTGSENVAIGPLALRQNTTGMGNVAIGVNTLALNTTGTYNTAIGCYALYGNTGGTGNFAAGYQALLSNKGGSANIAIGQNAVYTNVNGMNNIGLGTNALNLNVNGCANIGLGVSSLAGNTYGNENTAIGSRSLYSNTTGGYNIGIGFYSLNKNITGTANIGIGLQALMNGTTGGNNIGLGSGALRENNGSANIGIGNNALLCNTTGNYNIALGYGTMQSPLTPSTGGNNIAIGNATLPNITSGSWNVAIGYQAMTKNTTGIHNTAIGYQSLYSNITGQCNVAIGYTAGSGETNSGRLHIANCSTKSLIYGEFDNNYVKICGCLEASCAIKPASSADAGMPNNSIYYSTNAGKLVYKDAGGIVNPLY